MDKNTLIENLKSSIQNNQISKEEVLDLFDVKKESEHKGNKIVYALYVIGALISLVGIGFLLSQFWTDIGVFGRVFATLGLGIITFAYATYLKEIENRNLSQILYFISVIFMPAGIFILFDEMNVVFSINNVIAIFVALTLIYGVAWYASRKNILILLTLAFSSIAYWLFVNKIIYESMSVYENIFKYASMLLSISLGAIAYSIRNLKVVDRQDKKEKKIVSEILYAVSTLGFLIPLISFGSVMDFVAILVLFAFFYLSIYFGSLVTLLVTAIIFIFHLSALSIEFFGDSLGFAFTMIFIGFLIMAVGYVAFYLNKTYLKKEEQAKIN